MNTQREEALSSMVWR